MASPSMKKFLALREPATNASRDGTIGDAA
jgi:hypothetical protein